MTESLKDQSRYTYLLSNNEFDGLPSSDEGKMLIESNIDKELIDSTKQEYRRLLRESELDSFIPDEEIRPDDIPSR